MKKYSVMDGNEACATAAYYFTEVAGIYPITPASPMATLCDKFSSEGKKNLFGDIANVIEMQSEAGASGVFHGSLQGGSLSTTFTASQGLLLMLPTMYKVAGEMLPGVIHVAARSLSTHALSIFGDHQDIYAVRSSGFSYIASSNVQDAYYLALITHLSALKSSIPFLHFFDGFRTSHELNKIEILEDEDINKLINKEDIKKFKKRSLNISKNTTRGTSQTEDIYFQMTEARNKYYDEIPNIVKKEMDKLNILMDTNYKPFNYYGSPKAKKIIIAMGSVCETIKEYVKQSNEEIGFIEVHLYRPFSVKYLLDVLPKTVRKIAVIDRTKEPGSEGEPLYLDVKSALSEKNIEVIGGRYGLSSKNTTPALIKSVFDNLDKQIPINRFTVGIIDDVTNLSLKETKYKLNKKYKEIKVYAFGSDGMVSGCKNLLKVIAKDNFIQGYFEYDSKKSSGVTISHLRIDNEQIKAPYYTTEPSLVVVTKEDYLNFYDVLEGIKPNGIFVLNSDKTDIELNNIIPNKIKEEIQNKNIKFFVTSADALAKKHGLKGKISSIITTYMLKMLGCSIDNLEEYKKILTKTYSDKGQNVIDANINLVDEATDYIREFNKSRFTFKEEIAPKDKTITDIMLKRRGDLLPVSNFIENADGTFEGGTSKSDKRKLSSLVPKWNKDNCIECNNCSIVCPHAVIRAHSIKNKDLSNYKLSDEFTIPSSGEVDKSFYISVSETNCTGCGLCMAACPGKNEKKALSMGTYDKQLDKISDLLNEKHINETDFNKYTIKGLGFKKPYFEFPGACAGCGETSYLKILTQLYKDELIISNATGCSSIYGASLPSTPYKIPWINSLFEDNAEVGLGLYSSYEKNKEKIKQIMYKTKDEVHKSVKDIYKKWITNMDDYDITREVYEELKEKSIPKELNELYEYIPSKKIWIVGGDGWAYDIGYGGLDHVLHTNSNVKVLVLDSEVYSNTGGQASKSTKASAIAEFTSNGKKTNKKDLFRMLMAIPNVYVASVSLKASPTQTLKAFKEANEHVGPSVIIAYSPCIAHGIKGGLSSSTEEEKLLVETGYNILMRYKPNDGLYIDSKEPDFSKYEEVFKKELRYKNLEELNAKEYNELYNKNIDFAKKRFEYYKTQKKEIE